MVMELENMEVKIKNQNYVFHNQHGATIVFVAICMVVIISFAAIALDVGHLVVTKNELQNAADAGALAGAHKLYGDNGRVITRSDARQAAITVSTMNKSDNVSVDVEASDVLIGHWSFGLGALAKGFTESSATEPVPLWGVTTVELDQNTDFINAVQVTAWRKEPEVTSWFARIFGIESFLQSAKAVAYIGFAGSVEPEGFDQPIAICRESLLQRNSEGEAYWDCNMGRMLDSSTKADTSNTGAWTNLTQDPCETASVPTIKPLICGTGNPMPMLFGQGIGAVGGVQDTVFKDLADCWIDSTLDTNNDNLPETVWPDLRLPVVLCPGNNVSNCPTLVGMVELDIIWVERNGILSQIDQASPKEMLDPREAKPPWPDATERAVTDLEVLKSYYVGRNDGDLFPTQAELDANYTDPWENGKVRWASFVRRFNLLNADDQPASWQHKAIYFMPQCDYHEPEGTSQGENYGVLARVPVLVD
jgi:hypothetical protein